MFTIRPTRSPLADLQVATGSLNRLFDEALRGWPELDGQFQSGWMPPVDVVETAEEVRIVAELPGVKPDAIGISVENNVLTLRGEKPQPETGERTHRIERSYGSFERRFTVPATVAADRIQARYEHGVLTLTLPRAEAAKPRQITVQVQA